MPEGAWRRFGLAASMLFRRELLHFWRERTRVLGFAMSPLLFWLVVGAGFHDMTYFLPGAVLLGVMFTAVFSTMSVIDDRKEGFLLSVLASPAPRCSLVIGKVLGGAVMAASQGVLFLGATLFILPAGSSWNPFPALAALLTTGFSFTALGFWMAWRSRSSQGFHAVMNVVLMPLWMLSGAIFPPEKSVPWLRELIQWNPLRYFLTFLERTLTPWQTQGSPAGPAALTLAIGVMFLTLSVYAVERSPQGADE